MNVLRYGKTHSRGTTDLGYARGSSADSFEILERDYVQSLERGLAIIRSFGPDSPTMTLGQTAERAGLTRAATRRFLLTLVKLGYVGTDKKKFWLRSRILDLGYHYLASQPWWHVAQPVLEETARLLKETCNISILDEQEIVYLCRVVVSRIIATNLSIGSRLPAYATAMGRVLLAHLSDDDLRHRLASARLAKLTKHTIVEPKRLRAIIGQARDDGFAMINQELEIGLIGLAVPIVAPSGGVVAALGVSLQTGRIARSELIERFVPVLRQASQRITQGLAGTKRVQTQPGV